MAQKYTVPEKYGGKTIEQITNPLGFGSGKGLLPLLGIGAGQQLQAGQTFNVTAPPGVDVGGSAEFQTLGKIFGGGTAGATTGTTPLATQQIGDEASFMSALQEKMGGQEKLGAASERIGGELGLPALRQSAFDLTQTLKGVGEQVRDVAPTQQTIAKQVGISAPNLQRRIAAETAGLQPALESAGRAAQTALSGQQFSEEELGRRLGLQVAEQEKELRPFFEAQLPLLQDRLARESNNYNLEQQRELDQILLKMSQGFQASQNDLNRANQLATAELGYTKALEQIKFSTDESIRQSLALRKPSGGGGGNITSDIQSILQELEAGQPSQQGSVRII